MNSITKFDVVDIDFDTVSIDEIPVPYESNEFQIITSLRASAGTNGAQGGDAGHGCRTYVRLQDAGGTVVDFRPLPKSLYSNGGVEIVLGGDSELWTAIDAFRYIADTLEKMAHGASVMKGA